MTAILYDTNETAFASNGLGRLRDCITCVVTEERNGIYECDFEYPMDGENFDQIRVGRIIGVTHDESGDIQPFDIVSYSRPIDGVVTFHCTHISYRQSYMTVTGSNINSLADAFTLFASAEPNNPFSYQTDKTSAGYMAAADGLPKSVRSMLGGIEGSILDAYGGEYEWNRWSVILHSKRGVDRDFSIRYGVNMVDYNEDFDSSGTYSSVIPYWTDGTNKVIGDRQDGAASTITGRGECVPLDVSDKFESQPTKSEVEAAGLSYISTNSTYIPTQNIHVEFIRLQDMPEYAGFSNLFQCNLCDTINVVFPDYNSSGRFKIVKTVWDVLADRYESMELGDLSVTLAEALGISNANEKLSDIEDYIDTEGANGEWRYRKWKSGKTEAWATHSYGSVTGTSWGSTYYSDKTLSIPSGIFTSGATILTYIASDNVSWGAFGGGESNGTITFRAIRHASNAGTMVMNFYCVSY